MKITEVEIFDVKLTPRVITWNPVIVRINADGGIVVLARWLWPMGRGVLPV